MSIINKVVKRISPYMKSMGFWLSGRNYCYISNDIAYCIALEAPSGLLYVTAYVMPLYIPCENRYYTYGSRLNNLNGMVLPLLRKDDNDDVIARWCDMLCQLTGDIIIPFYQQIGTPSKLVKYVERKIDRSSILFTCPKVFVEQLRMYTYLYLGDYNKTLTAMNSYRKLIETCTFLANTVCQKHLDGIDAVQTLLRCNETGISDFCCEISEKTKKLLNASTGTVE